jgi:peptidase C39-like protein
MRIPNYARSMLAGVLCASVSGLASGTCTPPAEAKTATRMHAQETWQWCYAASGQMVMETLGKLVSQCSQANHSCSRTDCCGNPTPAQCVVGGWPPFAEYGFTFQVTSNQALSWEDLRKQIGCERIPIAFSWHWVGGSGHMMVAYGYRMLGASRMVRVLDPWPVNAGKEKEITYEEYAQGSDHTHWNDYYDVRKSN